MSERIKCISCNESMKLELAESYVSLSGNECPLCKNKLVSNETWEKVKND